MSLMYVHAFIHIQVHSSLLFTVAIDYTEQTTVDYNIILWHNE